MSQPLLALRGVKTYYGNVIALKGVDVDVNEGEIVALIGANGAGKSTLMMTVFGNPRAREGAIHFAGRDITALPTHEIAKLRIAQAPEGRRIFPRMTVMENLQIGATVADATDFETDLARIFTLFPRLRDRAGQRGGTLSGGEQQMLAIGRALMTNPRLLILDEATEGLAPLIRDEIWNCLSMLKARGQSVLVIDKNVGNLTRIADRHYIIERGRAVWSGTSEALIAEPDLQHRYLGV
jgi:branched-chain amino acid transport system ATP-binding protein